MDNKTLKSSIKAYCLELMQEISALGGEGSYLTKKAYRKTKPQDVSSPTGFESSPNPNMYTKTMKFRIVKPKERLNSKDLWKEIKVEKPLMKGHITSGDEDNILIYKKGVRFIDNKQEILNSLEKQGVADIFDDLENMKFSLISFPETGDPDEKLWWDDDEIILGYLHESHYTQFKKQTTKPKPKEVLHRAIKEIQMKLDEVNKLIDYTTRIKGELTEGDQEIEYLNRTKNSIHKIYKKLKETFEKMSSIDEIKIEKPIPFSEEKLEELYLILHDEDIYDDIETDIYQIYDNNIPHEMFEDPNLNYIDMIWKLPLNKQKKIFSDFLNLARKNNIQI